MKPKTSLTENAPVTRKKSKPKDRFQELWDEAARVKEQNLTLEHALDDLVNRITIEITPYERELGIAMRAQMDKLIVFAGRKSLAQWQVQVLDDWIYSNLDFLHPLGLVDDELRNNLARLQAKSLGIAIDESSDISMIDQLNSGLDERFNEHNSFAEDHAFDDDEDLNEDEEFDFLKFFEEKIAQMEQEEALGLEDSGTEQSANQDYSTNNINSPEQRLASTKTMFKTLFHRVARALHPDKEVDPEKMVAKQALMSELLDARRQKDLMTVIQLYQEHVSDAIDFSKEEIRELQQVLIQYIDKQHLRYIEIASKSYLHHCAYHEFYNANPKKIEKAIDKKIKSLKAQKIKAQKFTETVSSLKALRPYLEERHDAMVFYYQ